MIKKRLLAAAVMFSIIISSCILPQAGARYDISEYKNGEVIAVYKNGDISLHTYDDTELSSALSKLRNDPAVHWVQPNYKYAGAAANDEDYIYQWWLENDGTVHVSRDITSVAEVDININPAWDIFDQPRAKITVAVLDTGVEFMHVDIQDSVWINTAEIPDNGIDDDKNGYIDDVYGWNFFDDNADTRAYTSEHGTHLAGIISATADNYIGVAGICGMTDAVDVMNLKVLGENGEGSTYNVVQAIKYAERMGAEIINLSLQTDEYDDLLYSVMEKSKMLFIVAAGNEGHDIDATPAYPSSYTLPNIISVANLMPNGELHKTSNYSKESVDIAAPGTYIYSTVLDNGYGFMTGTSMAAPMVAGVAALVYSYYGGIDAQGAKKIILDSANVSDSLTNLISGGRTLNAAAALSYSMAEAPWSSCFKDVKARNWYYKNVAFAYRMNLIKGTSADMFSPNSYMNRAMITAIIHRHAGSPAAESAPSYTDIPETKYYYTAAAWALENAIAVADTDIFGANEQVTREELVLMMYNYAAYSGADTSPRADITTFTDYTELSPECADAMSWAVSLGIIEGMSNNRLNPQSGATRAQFAAILQRFCENIQ